jgi:hypothetical protein
MQRLTQPWGSDQQSSGRGRGGGGGSGSQNRGKGTKRAGDALEVSNAKK